MALRRTLRWPLRQMLSPKAQSPGSDPFALWGSRAGGSSETWGIAEATNSQGGERCRGSFLLLRAQPCNSSESPRRALAQAFGFVALSLTPGGRRTRFKEHRGRVPFSAASESAPVGVSPRNRLYPGPASGIPRTTSLLSSQAWDLQPQILQGAGEELEEAGEGTPSTPPSASRARRGPGGQRPRERRR